MVDVLPPLKKFICANTELLQLLTPLQKQGLRVSEGKDFAEVFIRKNWRDQIGDEEIFHARPVGRDKENRIIFECEYTDEFNDMIMTGKIS